MAIWNDIAKTFSLAVENKIQTQTTHHMLLAVSQQVSTFRSEVLEALARIEEAIIPPAEPLRFVICEIVGGELKETAMEQMKVTDKKKFALVAKDAKGNISEYDGMPVWSVTDASLLAIEVAADGKSVEVSAVGPIGTAKLQASVDAQMGDGEKPVLGEAEILLLPGETVSVELVSQ